MTESYILKQSAEGAKKYGVEDSAAGKSESSDSRWSRSRKIKDEASATEPPPPPSLPADVAKKSAARRELKQLGNAETTPGHGCVGF